jgi:transcriptional regulator with XRE-family HTH domain
VTISAGQLRAARGLLGWSQSDLAEAAKISRATIADFESGKRDPYVRTLDQLRATLEAAGIEFTNGARPGVRMKQWERDEKVRLRQGLERHASTFGIEPNEIVTIEEWESLPGQAPSGHLRVRRSSGKILLGLPASHFERVPPEPGHDPQRCP